VAQPGHVHEFVVEVGQVQRVLAEKEPQAFEQDPDLHRVFAGILEQLLCVRRGS
jgi:hypothetical protein